MANIKITDLDAYTNPEDTDVLPIVDIDSDETKKVTIADLMENAGDGTEALPGIAFDADPNTGIYRPGADQIAISTNGAQRLLINSSGVVTVAGDLTVNGTTTTVNSTTVSVDDKNIELGSVASPTDTTADGGGISLLGDSTKTLNWVNSTDSWTSSENVDLASGKTYKVNGTDVLSGSTLGSGVTGSSLTSVGTIATGTWQGTPIATAYIAGDAIDGSKIADDSIDSEHYVDGSIDTVHLADDAVNADKLANTAVTAGSYTRADITVDAQGRITSASNGSTAASFPIDGGDNDKILLGTDDDLEIFHDGTDSVVKDAGAGVLSLRGSGIYVQNEDGSKSAATFVPDNQTQLMYNGSVKLATTTGGINVTGEIEGDSLDIDGAADISGNVTLHGNLDMQDNAYLLMGAGDDLQLYHDGSNSYIKDTGTGSLIIRAQTGTYIQSNSNGTDLAAFIDNAGAYLYYAGSQKVVTTSSGIDVTGTVACDGLTSDGQMRVTLNDDPQLVIKDGNSTGDAVRSGIAFTDSADATQGRIGYILDSNDDLYIYNNRAAQLIFGTSNANRVIIDANGNLLPNNNNSYDLGTSSSQWKDGYFDGVVHCDQLDVDGTIDISGDASFFGNVNLADNDRLRLGSSADFSIYHDGSHTRLENNTGHLYIRNNFDDDDDGNIYIQAKSGENGIVINDDNDVKLFYDNAEKLATTSTGINVTGSVTCDGLTSEGTVTVETGSGGLVVKENVNAGDTADPYILGKSSDNTSLWYYGTGTASATYSWNYRNGSLIFGTNNTARCFVSSSGHFVPETDDAYDIGTTSNQWRDAHFDGTVNCDGAAINGKCTSSENTATASAFNLANGNFWTCGAIQVPNPTNQAAGLMGSLRVTAAPVSFAGDWQHPGGSYTAPTSFPAVAPFFVQASGTILLGSWTEGIA